MLNSLKAAPGSRKSRKRAGRGNSAGRGTTAGRGTKGQGSRSGSSRNRIFEGGQTPLLQRQPKLGGFKNPNRVEYEVVNLGSLEEKLDAGKYDVEALKASKLIATGKRVKLLARGEVKKKFDITVHSASKAAIEAIEKAGGKVTVTV
jgi:large subunit ribosomal protein L15